MAENQLQGATGAMNPEDLKKFVGALDQVSRALDAFGELFGYKNEDVEKIRKGYFGLSDLRMEVDPKWAAGQKWVA